jgi:drug/metabolite transporter (DMT)-like permease
MRTVEKCSVGYRRELGLLGVLAIVWGSSFLLIKVALATIPPVTLIAARVSIAALILLIVMRVQRIALPGEWRIWRMLLVQAFFNSIGSWTMLAWGQQYVDSGLAGVLGSTSPIFVVLITALVARHEAVSARRLMGTLVGAVGVVLITGTAVFHGFGQQVFGQLAILLGSVLYACAAIHGTRFSASPATATATAAGTMLWATACLCPLSLILDRPWTLTPSLLSVAAALLLGIVCTGGAMLLYFRLLRSLGSMGVASQSYLRAGVSVVLGMCILGEHVTVQTALGLAAIVLGVAAINTPRSLP